MLNLNFFKQKSPQQRFLFILGICMVTIFITLAIVLIFFSDVLGLDPEKLPKEYRIAFAILLVVYAGIRFGRIMKQND
ncbi:MAG: hypothetical protein EOO07_27380 [Chitinophagaceae bacterium]|nr:MAG: hypothetical protein EOO07_27380 [Chitinophagaceae bacterium]